MKKILLLTLLTGVVTLGSVYGPRFRVDGSIGYGLKSTTKNQGTSYEMVSLSAGMMPEWRYELNDSVNLTFGPKMTVNTNVLFNGKASSQVENKVLVAGSLTFSGVGELSYRLAPKVEIYVGGELGTGVVGIQKEEKAKMALISKVSIGTKVVDKYTVGAYFGYGEKGITGLEVGYTF